MKAGRWNVIWKQIIIDRTDVNISRSKQLSLVVEIVWAVFDQWGFTYFSGLCCL